MMFKPFHWAVMGIVSAVGCSAPARQSALESKSVAAPNRRQCGDLREQMTHNDMPRNALNPEALTCSGALLDRISTSSLSTQTFASLQDAERAGLDSAKCPHTRELLSYVVSCALDPCDAVQTPGGELRGELGLCPQWVSGAPTEECQQVVSACVFARTNAWDKRVIISLRGHPALSLLEQVPVEKKIRFGGGTAIRSFGPCPDGASGRPERDCGWEARYVGRCEGSGEVTLTARQAPAMVRVCAGLYGCDHEGGVAYSRWIADKNLTSSTDRLSFPCPDNGPTTDDGQSFGYYSVMVASPDPSAREIGPNVDVTAASGDYPASEEEVFTRREGAFYGNIFQARARESGGQYACYSPEWGEDLPAFLAGRNCNTQQGECFASQPRSCQQACSQEDSDGNYRACSGKSEVWAYPLTTFLNHPEDLKPEDAARLQKKWQMHGPSKPTRRPQRSRPRRPNRSR